MKVVKHPPRPKAWLSPTYVKADVMAIKALAAGNANEGQQKRALAFIINGAASTYELSYRAESDRETVFAEGRRFVGLQLIQFMNMSARMLDKLESEDGR
ncbi:MAG: hypothetical protein H0U59_08490 [Gemmatimonadaceae bacterium]|nr:hypothetical protein [Gemmatimonadaceae bacterium]